MFNKNKKKPKAYKIFLITPNIKIYKTIKFISSLIILSQQLLVITFNLIFKI